MTKTLLFPTDFSSQSIEALKEAVALNQKLQYEIIIFHAFSRPFTDNTKGATDSMGLRKLEEKIDRQFQKLEKAVPKLKDMQYKIVKELGSSVDLIARHIKDDQVSLIIMNTKGAIGIGELWGTKTAKIIKKVDIPVLVIPTGTKVSDLSEIGLACDFSEKTEYDKVEFLVELAAKCDVPVDVITLNRHEKTMTDQELEYRDKLLEMLNGVKTRISFRESNNIKKGLIDYCQSNDIGLLGILPKSYTFIERAFHESLTTRMAFNSPIPLLVLK